MRVASVKLEAANWSRKWGKVGFRVFLYAGKFLIGIHFVAARLESLSLRKGFFFCHDFTIQPARRPRRRSRTESLRTNPLNCSEPGPKAVS